MQADALPDAVILCGGEARRLGGCDKPLEPLLGEPIVQRVARAIAPHVGRVLISANRNGERYAAYGEVIADGRHAGRGPLAGIAAALAAARSPLLLCVPGDAPALPAELVPRLRATQAASAAAIVHAVDGSGPQPLCCLIDRRLASVLDRYLEAGGRTPREWFAQQGALAVDFSDAPAWSWSLNTVEEWRQAEQRLQQRCRA